MSDNNNKGSGWKKIAALELAAMLALGGALSWSLFLRDDGGSEKTVPVNAGALASSQEETEPDVRTRAVIEKNETFYQLSGKKILYNDSSLGEVFLPVYEDVPAFSHDRDSITTRNGYSFYRENGRTTSAAGIDISEFQGDIDWQKVKAAGIDFVIVRVGIRTYGGGDIMEDKNYKKNISGAIDAGLHVGAYFFSQATSAEEAIEEADMLIDAVKPYDITYPLIFDWEIISGDDARTDTVSVDTLANCCVAFCERVKSAGYTPMIYQNKNTSMMKLDIQRLKDYPFWLAEYNTKPTYYYDFQIWQYASDGYVPGIEGDVDMNISFRDYSKPGAPLLTADKPAEKPAETTTTAVSTTVSSTTTAETTAATATTTKKAD